MIECMNCHRRLANNDGHTTIVFVNMPENKNTKAHFCAGRCADLATAIIAREGARTNKPVFDIRRAQVKQ